MAKKKYFRVAIQVYGFRNEADRDSMTASNNTGKLLGIVRSITEFNSIDSTGTPYLNYMHGKKVVSLERVYKLWGVVFPTASPIPKRHHILPVRYTFSKQLRLRKP